jgi:hypothetical protein
VDKVLTLCVLRLDSIFWPPNGRSKPLPYPKHAPSTQQQHRQRSAHSSALLCRRLVRVVLADFLSFETTATTTTQQWKQHMG